MIVRPRPAAAVARLFPVDVVAFELCGPGAEIVLTDAERRYCATFGAKRLADFAAGRACARRALETFGVSDFSLLVDADRRPRWPSEIVGSISHTDGYCAAVVAARRRVRSLGFDAERTGRITDELWPKLYTSSERAWLGELSPRARPIATTVLFSAKEAFYKCRFGIDPEWLDFTEVELSVGNDGSSAGAFDVRLVRDGNAGKPWGAGRFAVCGDIVVAGIAVVAAV